MDTKDHAIANCASRMDNEAIVKKYIRQSEYYEAALVLLKIDDFDLEIKLLAPLYRAWRGIALPKELKMIKDYAGEIPEEEKFSVHFSEDIDSYRARCNQCGERSGYRDLNEEVKQWISLHKCDKLDPTHSAAREIWNSLEPRPNAGTINFFASIITKHLKAERDESERTSRAYEEIVARCRKTTGFCFCGCHIAEIND